MKWALEVVLLEFLEAFFTLIPPKVHNLISHFLLEMYPTVKCGYAVEWIKSSFYSVDYANGLMLM